MRVFEILNLPRLWHLGDVTRPQLGFTGGFAGDPSTAIRLSCWLVSTSWTAVPLAPVGMLAGAFGLCASLPFQTFGCALLSPTCTR